MKRQMRIAHVRDISGDGRDFTAIAVVYGVKDSFNTIFDRGVFNDSLSKRLPTLTFGHSWDDIVGRVKSWEDTEEGLIIHARLSDPEAVPRARQLMAQLRDGDIDDVSVGFAIEHGDVTRFDEDGVEHFVRATLNEVACVLRGAVPGARVLAVRSHGQRSVIEAETAGQILAQLQAGSLTLKEALQQVEDNTVDESEVKNDGEPDGETSGDETDPVEDDPDVKTAEDENEELAEELNEADLDAELAELNASLEENA